MIHNASTMAAYWKAIGIERQASYSQWVKHTQLKPGMNAKEWFAIWDSVAPRYIIETIPISVVPTHEMKLYASTLVYRVRVDRQEAIVIHWTHEHGYTGSDPVSSIEWLRPLLEPDQG